MNIAINMACTLEQKTGIGHYTYNLMKALIDNYTTNLNNEEYKFFSYAYSNLFPNLDINNPVNNEETNKEDEVNEVKKLDIIRRILYSIPFYITIRQKMLQNKNKQRIQEIFEYHKINIYHEPNFFIEPKKNTKSIVTIHDFSFWDVPYTHKKSLINVMDNELEKSVNISDKIICDSNFTKQRLLHYFPNVSESKVKVIYLGANDKNMSLSTLLQLDKENNKENENNIFLQKYNLKSKGYILSVGTIEPRKNILTLINAFLQLPNTLQNSFPLVIVGKRGWLNDKIFEKINALEQQQKLYFLNYVSDEDLIRLYANAKVFCYPSIYEGFGLPPLEAMASGIPVITSNSSSLPEVVGDGVLMHDSLDDLQLKQYLSNVLTDEELHKNLSEYSLNRSKLFSWKKTAEQTLQVYKEAYNE